ncbi:MAG: hypothetical protein R2764_00395 [Bacteroidales bacterium]
MVDRGNINWATETDYLEFSEEYSSDKAKVEEINYGNPLPYKLNKLCWVKIFAATKIYR